MLERVGLGKCVPEKWGYYPPTRPRAERSRRPVPEARAPAAAGDTYVNLETGSVAAPRAAPVNVAVLLIEAASTFVLSLALLGGFGGPDRLSLGSAAWALAVGAVYTLLLWASGATCNGAVTLMILVRDRTSATTGLLTLLSQSAGAALAAFAVGAAGGGGSRTLFGTGWALPPLLGGTVGEPPVEAYVSEGLLTLCLCLVFGSLDASLVDVGFGYFGGLFAFCTQRTRALANPSVSLGFLIADALLGARYELAAPVVAHVATPLLVGAALPVAAGVLERIELALRPAAFRDPAFRDFESPQARLGTEFAASGLLALWLACTVSAHASSAAPAAFLVLAQGAALASSLLIAGVDRSLNPAISLCHYVREGQLGRWADPLLAAACQLVGATLGAAVALSLLPPPSAPADGWRGAPSPIFSDLPTPSIGAVLTLETAGTFLLALVLVSGTTVAAYDPAAIVSPALGICLTFAGPPLSPEP